MSININKFLRSYMIEFGDLGSVEMGGVDLDDFIEAIENDSDSPTLLLTPEIVNIIPLIYDEACILHPIFIEHAGKSDIYHGEDYYSPDRLPISFFDIVPLEILFFDQDAETDVCSICYRQHFWSPDYWEVYGRFLLPRNYFPALVDMFRKIQCARLEDLFDSNIPSD